MMEKKNKIFVQSVAHISAQKPLSEEWMDCPIFYHEHTIGSIDLNYKDYFAANTQRRMGKLLKRAMVCAQTVLERAEVDIPDAIITATGLGCIQNTEIFLDAMVKQGETCLNPTPFMQSTHNTIGSAIALKLKCRGYNTHYSQQSVSFDCGLQDAMVQLKNEKVHSVLLNAHDEHSPIFDKILDHLDCWHFENNGFKGELALSVLLTNQPKTESLCCVEDMMIAYKPSIVDLQTQLKVLLHRNRLTINDIDFVFLGTNGNLENDSIYQKNAQFLFPNLPEAHYKHIFGEHYTMSGVGFYVAATCLHQNKMPQHLLIDKGKKVEQINQILLYNHSENKEHSFILLSK